MTTTAGHERRLPTGRRTGRVTLPPSAVLFTCLFAAQSCLLVLSPILPAVAADLDVSIAAGAQLRSVSGFVAGAVALWLAARSRPRPLRDVLLVGVGLLAAGCVGSAAAPSFPALVAAQLVIGAALGIVLSSALAAAGTWASDRPTRTLSWTLAGQPVAWVVGMPVVGVVAEVSWRLAWLAVPLVGSLAAIAALLLRGRDRHPSSSEEPPIWRQPGVAGWAVGELFAYGGWAGTLVFIGALFVDSYGSSTTAVGLILAAGAAAYVPGNFLARRLAGSRPRWLLLGGALASSAGIATLGFVRPGVAFSAPLFALVAFVAGGRTLAGGSLGLLLAPHCRLQSMGLRTAAVQYGYLLGAALGGVALAGGGYRGLGATLALLSLLAAAPHLGWVRRPQPVAP